jgi:hypothetical protein
MQKTFFMICTKNGYALTVNYFYYLQNLSIKLNFGYYQQILFLYT